MSHLLKRTKKSCLKLLRKISSSKQLFVQRLEEDDLSNSGYITFAPSAADTDELKAHQYERLNNNNSNNNNNNAGTASPNRPVHLTESPRTLATPDKQPQALDNVRQLCKPKDQQQQQQEQQQHWEIDENQNRHALRPSLTSKFFLGADGYEFQRLRQLRSDAASEISEWDAECMPKFGQSTWPEVQFERVPYKQNVRYLRHTPSNSSLDMQQQEPAGEQTHTSLGHKFDSHYCNVVIAESPHDDYPIDKWDINGNSLDDEQHFDFNARNQNDLESRCQHIQLQRSNTYGIYSQRSSHQSSSCTLETWIDDTETFSGRTDDSDNNLSLRLTSF